MWKVKELSGCEVYDINDNKLGILEDVLPSSANDIWVVKDGKKEFLIPALVSVVKNVDIVNKKIKIDLPPGLKEIYEIENENRADK